MENNYKEQHSQLLQIIYDAHKNGDITKEQKLKIKELMMNHSSVITEVMSEYSEHKSKELVIKSLKFICNEDDGHDSEDDLKNHNELDQLSSPLDRALYFAKQRRMSNMKDSGKSPVQILNHNTNSP